MLQILGRRDKGQSLVARLGLLPTEPSDQSKTIDVRSRPRFYFGFFGWSFVLCVILPALVAGAYFTFIASYEYVSEAHFTIRKAGENKSAVGDVLTGISASAGLGIGTSSTTQDIFIVADYIRSRTIIEDIGGKPLLFKIYSQPNIDWLSRLSASAPLEKIWKYWKQKISAIIDTPSGIITLDVRAFTRDDAHQLAQLILNRSEALVNDISERSRRDALMRAQNELKLAEGKLQKAQAELLAFRTKTNLIDPMLSAKSISDTIGKLTRDRIALENNRASLGSSVSSESPTLRVLNAQIIAIDQQISSLQNQLTSQSKNDAISGQIAGYENAQLEVQFAGKLYSIAQDSYEAARREQEKQQLFLVTVDHPSMPENSAYPRILLDTMTVFAGCLILWSMATLLVASVRDHMGG